MRHHLNVALSPDADPQIVYLAFSPRIDYFFEFLFILTGRAPLPEAGHSEEAR